MRRPLVFGHRGARGYAPENTLESFRLAKSMRVNGIEFDVHMSKDGHLVIIHDDAVNRTANGAGLVRNLTLKQLKGFDVGIKFGEGWRGARIPTLKEVFSEIRGVLYKIELKHGSSIYPDIEEKLLREIENAGMRGSVRITSFDYDALKKIRMFDETIELGLIFHGRTPWFVDAATKLKCQWLQANYDMLEPLDVTLSHSEGFRIGVWGFRNDEGVRGAISMGVDDITSDYPDRVLALLKGN